MICPKPNCGKEMVEDKLYIDCSFRRFDCPFCLNKVTLTERELRERNMLREKIEQDTTQSDGKKAGANIQRA
jgi:hypothetical protein